VSRRAQSGTQWSCSAESRFTLIDRAATAPGLWDVRKGAGGKAELWLALSSAAAGPFRAIFANPADANGFANWLHQTHAAHVGAYELGMFRPGYSRENLRTVPERNSITETFREVSQDDVESLVAGRLGEP
jgi:hypothetical protein